MNFDLQPWEINGLLKNANLLTIPEFQREKGVWNTKRKKLLIDSILKGWKIPKIYLNNSSEQEYEIIDGQQRIYTILEFLANGFKIEMKDGNKVFFKDLKDGLKDSILNYRIDVEIIRNATEKDVSELFSRLQEGVPLNSPEKLNAIAGKLNKFIEKMAKHPYFSKIKLKKKRYGLKSICQQIYFLQANNIETAKYSQMRDFFEKKKNSNNLKIRNEIMRNLDFMNNVFEGDEYYLSKTGNLISIYLLCSWILNISNQISNKKLHSFFNEFYAKLYQGKDSDGDFVAYNICLLQSTTGAQSIKQRDRILKKYLYLYEPSFIINNTGLQEFYKAVEESLGKKVERIQGLVREINERAISAGKHVVFDVTGESSRAFFILGRRIKNINEYKEMIKVAWKMFYEGSQSGNKISALSDDRNHIKPIKDVNIIIKINDLRNEESHDLEHDRSTYEQKVKIASDIRSLYTNKMVLNDFDESDFLIFQYKIVDELLGFLEAYNLSIR